MIYDHQGLDVSRDDIHPALFPFQRDITLWALRKGRAAIFANTGLGKTIMQLEWARHVCEQGCHGRVLIVAPLSVARQTVAEAGKFNVPLRIQYARGHSQVADGITITNYEMVHHFDPELFDGVVLDESSILKALDGKTRTKLIQMFQHVPFRLACTATPAPNDIAELGNHAEFLGVMSHTEMLSAFFVHGDLGKGQRQGWRLKGHAQDAFYRWLSSWAMSVRLPSDIGDYSNDGYILPELRVHGHFVDSDYVPEGMLFATKMHGVSDRAKVRKGTLADRVAETMRLIKGDAIGN